MNHDLTLHHLVQCFFAILRDVKGASSESRERDLAKLKTLSATLYQQELLDAGRRMFCFRSQEITRIQPPFKVCAASMPCFLTLPHFVSICDDSNVYYMMNVTSITRRWN